MKGIGGIDVPAGCRGQKIGKPRMARVFCAALRPTPDNAQCIARREAVEGIGGINAPGDVETKWPRMAFLWVRLLGATTKDCVVMCGGDEHDESDR